MDMSEILTACVVKRKDLTDDLFILWLAPRTAGKFSFKPGQYCTIGMKGIWRAYSIVSAPHEERLELFVELLPGGELTPLLHKLKVGDSVDLLPKAKGVFTFEPKYKNHVMVATVTGVVPYISIIRDCKHRTESRNRFFVLQGASHHNEFGYYDELCKIVRGVPGEVDLTYIPTVSQPHEHRNSMWYGSRGRVNEILEGYISTWQFAQNLWPENTLIYACGHPGMIKDVKARLLPKGWKVKEERFWKE
jgi:ferredoxin--NADP+ reductase